MSNWKRQRDYLGQIRPKKKKQSWRIVMSILFQLIISVARSDVCGTQSNLHQWSSDLNVSFEMMHGDSNYIVVGATTDQVQQLATSSFENVQTADTSGALLSIYDLNDASSYPRPYKATVLSTISSTVKVSGFQAIKIDAGLEAAFAVLKTDNDDSGANIYIVTYYISNADVDVGCNALGNICFTRKQLQILKLSLTSSTTPLDNCMLATNDRVFLGCGISTTFAGILTVAMDFDANQNLKLKDSKYAQLKSGNGNNIVYENLELKAFSSYADKQIVHVSTGGQCGILVTQIDDKAKIKEAQCFDLTVQNTGEDFEPVDVFYTQGTAVTVLLWESSSSITQKSSFITAHLTDLESENPVIDVKKYGFTDSSKIEYIQANRRGTLLDFVIIHDNGGTGNRDLYLITGYDASSSSSLMPDPLKVTQASRTSSTDFKLHKKTEYDVYFPFAEDKIAYVGEDFIYKFDRGQTTTPAADCIDDVTGTAASSSSLFTDQWTNQQTVNVIKVDKNTDIATTSTLSNTESSEGWSTNAQFAVDVTSNSLHNQNTCQIRVSGLFNPTEHNLININPIYATTMSIDLTQSDECSSGVKPSYTYSDLTVQTIAATYDDGGPSETTLPDVTQLLDFASSSGGSDVMQVSAEYDDFSLKQGLYSISYKVGFVVESSSQILSLPEMKVNITLVSSCAMTLPTYTTNSAILDTFTYVRGQGPLVYTFTGFSAECLVTREFWNGNVIDNTHDTYTVAQDSTSDTFTVENNELTEDFNRVVQYKMTSVKDPTIIRKIQGIPVNAKVSTCTQFWSNPIQPTIVYTAGDPAVTSVFDQVDISNCPFKLQMTDVTDPSTPINPNASIFTLTQPVLVNDSADSLQVSVGSYGALQIQADLLNYLQFATYRIRLDIISQRYTAETAMESSEFDVVIKGCTTVASDQETSLPNQSYALGDSQLTIAVVNTLNATCPFSTFTILPNLIDLGSSFSNDTSTAGQLSVMIQQSDIAILQPGNFSLQILETDHLSGKIAKTTVEYEVTGFCTQFWTHTALPDTIYVLGEPLLTILFDQVSINDCPFKLKIQDITDPSNIIMPNTELFTLKQPVLTEDPTDLGSPKRVIVDSFGSLDVFGSALEESLSGYYTLQLDIISQRYPGETQKESIQLNMTIAHCKAVMSNQETVYPIEQTYTLGDPQMELVTVSKLNPSCPYSIFEVVSSAELGLSQTVQEDFTTGQISVFVEQSSSQLLPVGLYQIRVSQIDSITGFRSTTIVNFVVQAFAFDPSEFLNLNDTQVDETDAEEIDEAESEEESGESIGDQDSEESQADDESEQDADDDANEAEDEDLEITEAEIEASVVIADDGKIVYPWQRITNEKKNKQQMIEIEEEIKPLRSYIRSVTPTGNMTIAFTKPIILPPLRVDSLEKATNETNTTQSGRRMSGQPFYSIQQAVSIRAESGYYEEGDDEIALFYYNLTRLTEEEMDIQLNFKKPTKISQNTADPDEIIVEFKRGSMFMDNKDREQLESDLQISFFIQPQISAGELTILQNLCGNVASSIKSFSYVVIVPQAFFAMALKYLWNFMNLLQFLIFMLMWQIKLPEMAKITIKELRSIAFLEFIPVDFILKPIKNYLLGEQKEEKEDSQDSCVSSDSGIDRVGSTSLMDNMGVMFLIGALLIVILVLFCLLRVVTKRCKCAQKATQAIKKKLFYNTFLRFVLQSTLKLQISACTIIAYEEMTTHENTKPPSEVAKIQSWAIIVILNLCPFLFYAIVARNSDNLEKDEIQSKIGTLYNGLKASHSSVKSYSLTFLMRRSVFVAITFLLFSHPGMQVQLMIYMTLIQIIYIGHQEFYETRGGKSLEIINESIFVLIQYNFVLLHGLVSDEDVRLTCGYVMVGLTGLLLVINMAVIVAVSYKAIAWKCHLKKLKKRRHKEHQQEVAKKLLMKEIQAQAAQQAAAVAKNTMQLKNISAQDSSSSSDESSSEASPSSSSVSQSQESNDQPGKLLITTKVRQRSRDLQRQFYAKNAGRFAYRAGHNAPIVLKSNPFYNNNDYMIQDLQQPTYTKEVVTYESYTPHKTPPLTLDFLKLPNSQVVGQYRMHDPRMESTKKPLSIEPEQLDPHQDLPLQAFEEAKVPNNSAKPNQFSNKKTADLIKELSTYAETFKYQRSDSDKMDINKIGGGFFNKKNH